MLAKKTHSRTFVGSVVVKKLNFLLAVSLIIELQSLHTTIVILQLSLTTKSFNQSFFF